MPVIGVHVKCQLFFCDYNNNFIFSNFLKNNQIPNFRKIRPVGAKLLHVGSRKDRQTEMKKLTVASGNFSNAHKTT